MMRSSLLKTLVLVLIAIGTGSFFVSFKPVETEIKWYTFEEAVALSQKNPRKLYIDVYTDWCGWCKVMDKKTFKDPTVVEYVNTHFYAVKLNAEQKDTIRFQGRQFVFKQEYKANEIAVSLLNGQMSYPSGVFLDEKFNMLTVVPGYHEAPEFQSILKYFGENIYLNKNWQEYQQSQGK